MRKMEKQRKVGRLATMAAALSAALAVATNGTQGTVGKYNVASAQEAAQNERAIVAEAAASKAKWKRGDVPPPPTGEWSNAPAGTLKTLKINDIEYRFHYCPAGEFTMGSPESESGRPRGYVTGEAQHMVELTNGFWMLETEVTQAMWKAVMGSNPSEFTSSERNPVECVSWTDCQEFIKKLNSLGVAPRGFQFRLPSEAQWEYACRAGAAGPYAGASLDALGWYDANSGDRTHEVGTKSANAWGLYDMHGNVGEWCEDLDDRKLYEDWDGWEDYEKPNIQNLINPTRGSFRALRGGNWRYFAEACRSAASVAAEPTGRDSSMGFRLALVRSGSSSK